MGIHNLLTNLIVGDLCLLIPLHTTDEKSKILLNGSN